MGTFFVVKPGVNVNEQYYLDILLSQRMLTAIKYVTDNNKTAHWRIMRGATQSTAEAQNSQFPFS